ncbi:MAG: alpha/beta hydrolase [Acidobacteria bacterium]|nr:alpha/beta hydrolase [Acidobacteriota bacterium]
MESPVKVRLRRSISATLVVLCALLFLPEARTQALAARGERRNQTSVKKFVFGDVVIEAHIRGSGETIVLIPGQGFSADSFSALARRLDKAGYRTVAINPRGIEGSRGPLEKLTLKDYAGDVAAVVEALGLRRVHVLGHAYGNRVARTLASVRPDLVQTVILLAAGGRVGMLPEASKASERLVKGKLTEKEKLEAMRVIFFASNSDPSPWANLKEWKDASKAQLAAMKATPVETWWSGGSAPMLVVQGLEDKIAPPGNGHALREEFGERVTLVELRDAGHALIIEQPEAITKAISAFLKSQRNKPAAAAASRQ